jgi:hypothetical protein
MATTHPFFFDQEPGSGAFWLSFALMVDLEHAYLALGESTAGGSLIPQLEQLGGKMVALRKLKSLTITYWGGEEPSLLLPNFWRYFEFPNVQTLRLVSEHTDFQSWPQPDYSLFIDKIKSMENITRLSLCFNELREEDCARLFGVLLHVNYLDLEVPDASGYRGVLAALELNEGYLPELKTIVFEVGNESAFEALRELAEEEEEEEQAKEEDDPADKIIDVDALYSTISSRRTCEPEQRLQRIVFFGSEEWQVGESKPFNRVLEDLVEGGLVVENRVAKEARKNKLDDYWLEREECFDDWREMGQIFKLHAET